MDYNNERIIDVIQEHDNMDHIEAILKTEYGITADSIAPAVGGLSASAYKVSCAGGEFWLKEYDNAKINTAKQLEKLDLSMAFAFWLDNNTSLKGRVNSPIPTRQGELKAETPDYTYLLFSYIDGVTIETTPLSTAQQEELAEIVGELHKHGSDMPFDFSDIRENFEIPCDEILKIQQHKPDDSLCVYQQYDILLQAVELSKNMADQIKSEKLPFVLCHADIHGWNIMQSDKLILIDWESIRYAPVEADLYTFWGDWYWGDSNWGSYWDVFLPIYKKLNPIYFYREEVLRFYQLRRHIEDIEEFYKEYLYDDITEEEKNEIKSHLERECRFLKSMLQ